MGNIFKKETTPTTVELHEENDVPVRFSSIFNDGGGLGHVSLESFDDYPDENDSNLTNSSCTKPTVFNSQASEESSSQQKKIPDSESAVISLEQLESIYEQYKSLYPEIHEHMFLPPEILSTVTYLFERWQNDMIYNFDSYITYAQADKYMLKIFEGSLKDTANCNVENMFLRHSVGIIVTYKMILDGLKVNDADDIIEQLAISHGLYGTKGENFKVMDLHFTRYLLQRNLINDESIIAIVAFFSIVSDKISRVMLRRTSHTQRTSSQLPAINRRSITRDNYRYMKKWAVVTPIINSRIDVIQKQIKICKPIDKFEEETATISTQNLKADDFLMNIYKRKKEAKQ